MYHGGACSIRSRSLSKSKKRIFRVALCLVRYLVGASVLHPKVMCATLSGHLPQSRYLTLPGVSVPDLFWW